MKPLHLLIFLSAFNHVTYVGVRLIVLLYAAHLGASPAVVGVLAALFGLFAAITSVGVGRWIDRVGARTPLIIATVAVVAGGVLPFFWRDVASLFIVATLVGTFHNVFHIGQNQLVGQYGKPEDRAANFSLSSLGNSSAPVKRHEEVDDAPGAVGQHRSDINAAQLPLAKQRPRTDGSRFTMAAGLARTRLGVGEHMGATQIGTLMGTFALGTVLIRVVITFAAGRFTPWQMMVAALFTTGTGFLCMPFTEIFAVLLVIAFWLGTGLGIAGPMTMALLYDASPTDRTGEVVGLRVTLQNICQTAVPLLSGVMGAATGVGPVFWAIGAIVLWGCYDNRHNLRSRR